MKEEFTILKLLVVLAAFHLLTGQQVLKLDSSYAPVLLLFGFAYYEW